MRINQANISPTYIIFLVLLFFNKTSEFDFNFFLGGAFMQRWPLLGRGQNGKNGGTGIIFLDTDDNRVFLFLYLVANVGGNRAFCSSWLYTRLSKVYCKFLGFGNFRFNCIEVYLKRMHFRLRANKQNLTKRKKNCFE